ncbi:MAG: acetamidase/formamidase family protein [Paracoccaceae bacterium]
MAHHLDARPEHLFWGRFDPATPPALTVASGTEVALSCLPACVPEDLPPDGEGVRDDHRRAMEALADAKGEGPHMMTGPVAVEGARRGDVLQVDVLEALPAQPWGVMRIMEGLGALPDRFAPERWHVRVDPDANACHLPTGHRIGLAPFFGVLAVAPPREGGVVSSVAPGAWGGNLDCRLLGPGASVYLPVFEDGALFSAGDGHAVQGDGEVCVTAVETALDGRFRLTLRRDLAGDRPPERPWAETASHLIALGLDEDLDVAMRQAVEGMVTLAARHGGIEPAEAYMLASLAGHLAITQVVNGVQGVHMTMDKDALARG